MGIEPVDVLEFKPVWVGSNGGLLAGPASRGLRPWPGETVTFFNEKDEEVNQQRTSVLRWTEAS